MSDYRENLFSGIKRSVADALPLEVLDLWLMIKYQMKKSKFDGWHHQMTFGEIYRNNHWKNTESVSGPGSTAAFGQGLVSAIDRIIIEYKIKKVIDLPCGDFTWIRDLNFDQIHYTGADIVASLIESNHLKYAQENIQFEHLDLITNAIPKNDLLICRDCLPHLSFSHIFKAIENIKNSGCTYLLTTQYADFTRNFDIVTGDWRPVNLCRKPFDFPEPVVWVEEDYPLEYKRQNRGKKLALWRIDQL